jgi:hypothetical protein
LITVKKQVKFSKTILRDPLTIPKSSMIYCSVKIISVAGFM